MELFQQPGQQQHQLPPVSSVLAHLLALFLHHLVLSDPDFVVAHGETPALSFEEYHQST